MNYKLRTKSNEDQDLNVKKLSMIEFNVKENLIEDDEYFTIEGYASKFGGVDSYNDTVMKGAFEESIKNKPQGVPGLYQHNSSRPVGMFNELSEDMIGLRVKCKLPKSDPFVKDTLIPQIKCGAIQGLSIGYRTIEELYNRESGINTLIKVDLKEISFVTFPADEKAIITSVKKDVEGKVSKKDAFATRIEILRKSGTDRAKSELNDIYENMGFEEPFVEGSTLSTDEIKNLSMSNLSWALKNIKLSTNASRYIAELVMSATDSEHKNDSEGDDEIKGALESLINLF